MKRWCRWTTSIEPSFEKEYCDRNKRIRQAHRLRFGKKRRTFTIWRQWYNLDNSGDWGLTPDTEDSGTVYPYVYQNNLSDLEFVLERQKRIGYEVCWRTRRWLLSLQKKKILNPCPLNISGFRWISSKLSARYEGNESCTGMGFQKKEPISGKAKKGNEVSLMSAKKSGAEMTESAFGHQYHLFGWTSARHFRCEKVAIARFIHISANRWQEKECLGLPL